MEEKDLIRELAPGPKHQRFIDFIIFIYPES